MTNCPGRKISDSTDQQGNNAVKPAGQGKQRSFGGKHLLRLCAFSSSRRHRCHDGETSQYWHYYRALALLLRKYTITRWVKSQTGKSTEKRQRNAILAISVPLIVFASSLTRRTQSKLLIFS